MGPEMRSWRWEPSLVFWRCCAQCTPSKWMVASLCEPLNVQDRCLIAAHSKQRRIRIEDYAKPLMSTMDAQVGSEVAPLSESEQRAMAAWLKKGRHGRRADRNAHADHVLFRRLLQAQPPQPPMAGPPTRAPTLLNTGPVNALSITYRVNSIAQPVRAPAHVCPLVLSLACFLASWQAYCAVQEWGICRHLLYCEES